MPSSLNPTLSAFNYFEMMFKNTRENTILLLDKTGIILEINTAFTNCFGFMRDDVVGRKFDMLFTDVDRIKGLPQKEIAKVLTDGQASDNNFLLDKDKVPIWVSGESILVKDPEGNKHILKIIQNINKQKISETSVERLNNFNESILRSIEDMVVVLNANLEIVKANTSFLTLFGYSETEVLEMNFEAIIQPFDISGELIENIKRVIKTRESFFHYSIAVETGSQEKKAFDISCRVMEHSRTHNNILLVAHDITTQQQAEKEREDIIGFVAHELRNPLANIVLCNEMMTQLIADGEMNELDDYLHRSKNNVLRLNKMIGELYDATKFNSGNFRLEKTTFDFEQMVEEALDTLEVLHPDYSIVVEGECSAAVNGDRYRLIQVVTNFLSNGIKYSNNHTKVVIRLTQENGNVIVAVKDEGLGISPKQLPHIFGRFFRAEKTKNLEGIGLGLYLCHRIIEAHNGKIWAESEEGKGSTFYFSIPC